MWEYLTGDLSHNGVSPKCNEYRGGPGIPGGEVPFWMDIGSPCFLNDLSSIRETRDKSFYILLFAPVSEIYG